MIARWGLIAAFSVLVAGLVLSGCGGAEEAEGGVLTGTVTRNAACPAGSCPPVPASGVHLALSTLDGQEVKSVVTDGEGRYTTDLPSGSYRVEAAPSSGAVVTDDLPATVTVAQGQEARLDVSIEAETAVAEAAATPTDAVPPAPTVVEATVSTSTPPTAERAPAPTPTPVPPSTPTGEQPPAGMGLLAGQVTKGPTCPVESPGLPCPPQPVPQLAITISSLDGRGMPSVVTGADGRYLVVLPPGTYRVEVGPLTGIEFTKDLPATVTISAGEETRLDIHIDTGLR